MRVIRWLLIFVLVFSTVSFAASTSTRRSSVRRLRHRRHRVIFAYTPVKGSRESLLRQNRMISEEDLERIEDDNQLEALKQANELIPLPDNRQITPSPKLPEERRFVRPWTRKFLEDFSDKHFSLFHTQMEVTSAVRTVEFQHHLMRHNHNAAPESGELASPHLSGATIDIGKRGMSRRQLKWIRQYLFELQKAGVIDAEEEFRQPVFHITVYRDYELMGVERAAESTGSR
jgi:uncharacterized protein YcbK (DUF882 family)